MNDKDSKRRANVMVVYTLSRWFQEEHDKNITVEHNQEGKAVVIIREELKLM